jgi:hypothetical protein
LGFFFRYFYSTITPYYSNRCSLNARFLCGSFAFFTKTT